MRYVAGIHSVSAAVQAASGGKTSVDRVILARGARNRRLQALVEECRKAGIPVRHEPRAALERIAGTDTHQNVVAILAEGRYATLGSVLEASGDRCLIVVLDSVQDPRNLGAILRTAEAAGAAATVIPERRSAGLTGAASKAAAGAQETLPVIRVKTLGRALDQLKQNGFWIYGLDAVAKTDYDTVEFADRCALVLGSESKGMRQKVAERCDFLLRIPLAGEVPSLNVSAAAAVALFEVSRQRRSQPD